MTSLPPKAPVRICFPFHGGRLGGSHISALKLIQELDPRRFSPVVVLQDAAGPLAAFLREQGQSFVEFDAGCPLTLPKANDLGTSLVRTVPRLRRFIRQGEFAVVHTNDGGSHLRWGLAARLAGAKLVWHHRGDPDARGANWLAPLIADRIITVSAFARPRRPVLPLGRRLSVIHSPFERPAMVPDREAARSRLLAELGVAPGTRVLSFIGNLVDRKRPLLFIDAVAEFLREHPETPVVGCMFGISPAGRVDLEPVLRRRISALGLEGAVRLMGFRSPIEPYLAASDVLLVPAVNEPFGRTLIEAMFLGTPVVATRHGGNPEAIEHERTGFLVEPEDPHAFVAPVARLLRSQALWTRISRAAADQAAASFSVARHVERVTQVYGSALQARDAAERRAELAEGMP